MSEQVAANGNQVAIIAGGLSAERDVSIRSGRRVAEELRKTGQEVIVLDLDSTTIEELDRLRPKAVIPLVHGPEGESGSLQEVLTALKIPFIGAKAEGCRRSFDKSVAAGLMRVAGFTVPEHAVLPQSLFRELGAQRLLGILIDQLGLPVMVKPNRGGSALGVAKAEALEELPAAMVAAFAYGEEVIIEQFISGTEVSVSVIDTGDGPQALPAIEIIPDSGVYDYSSRYTAGSTEFFVPARIDESTSAQAAELALAAHETLGIRDWSRTDMIIDAQGVPTFIEINVAPGMTETSLFPQAVAASETTMAEVLTSLVTRATN